VAYPKARVGEQKENEALPSRPSFPSLETDVLRYWHRDKTFEASVAARDGGVNGGNEFVFYDGPPFANGLPHYGHLLTGYAKDVVPRYMTMKGKRVERRFGWDCHGLPAEFEAEKQLGISHKNEIEAMGIAKFNDRCRTSVLRYTNEWESYVTRQARWVDFAHDYKTLDLSYMESVMWAFKTLWDKGLIYEGFRVLWYCWRCETPLSNTETKMDDVYRDRQDPAVTVGLKLKSTLPELEGVEALVWTTTPWTLPSNLAAAVHPDVTYVVVIAPDGKRYLLAETRVAAYARELGESPTVFATFTGKQLLGTRYTPAFDFFAGRRPNAHQILAAEYVTTEDGTGIVHIAPAYGEEDKVITDAAGIEPVTPVNSRGEFDSQVRPYEGQHVFDANKQIIKDLRASGALLRHDTHQHSYRYCQLKPCKNTSPTEAGSVQLLGRRYRPPH
jgi:isoleucyl-tRNA synthetase